jgi:molybdopterin molybdotransferase
MLEIDEALRLVLEQARPLAPVELPAVEALGCVLAEAIAGDIDSPPHDKSIVDGYAVTAADLASGLAELRIVEEITAGESPRYTISPGSCSRIMTGAPIPAGADAVVMVERTQLLVSDRVRLEQRDVRPAQNIMRRAASFASGQSVLEAGTLLRPIEIGLLHEVGRITVNVRRRPVASVLATGNELVSAEQVPSQGQIRNSNGPMLCGLVQQAGGEAIDLGIGRDDRDHLQRLLARGLKSDVLVVSGGVSAGVLDLVPEALESLGVQRVFHKINLKPGKPLWFGVRRGEGHGTLVFGLPGNPVSSLVCFELFVRPALACLAGTDDGGLRRATARLGSDFRQRGDRVTMFPAAIHERSGRLHATPLRYQGSGDLMSLTQANGLIHFPAGDHAYQAGDEVNVLLF